MFFYSEGNEHESSFRRFIFNSSRRFERSDTCGQIIYILRQLSLEQTGFGVMRRVYFCMKLLPCLALRKVYTTSVIYHGHPWQLHGSNEGDFLSPLGGSDSDIFPLSSLQRSLIKVCINSCTHAYTHISKSYSFFDGLYNDFGFNWDRAH